MIFCLTHMNWAFLIHPISKCCVDWQLVFQAEVMIVTLTTEREEMCWYVNWIVLCVWGFGLDFFCDLVVSAGRSLRLIRPARPVVCFIDWPQTLCCTSIGLNGFSFFIGRPVMGLFFVEAFYNFTAWGIKTCFTSCRKIKQNEIKSKGDVERAVLSKNKSRIWRELWRCAYSCQGERHRPSLSQPVITSLSHISFKVNIMNKNSDTTCNLNN